MRGTCAAIAVGMVSACLSKPPFALADDPNVMFVTAAEVPALTMVPSLDDADARCQAAADGEGLGGTYIAWLSTSASDVVTRFASARGWVRVDGEPFASTVNDITAGVIYSPPRVDETGVMWSTGTVATGTAASGLHTMDTCGDLQGGGAAPITVGALDGAWPMWTETPTTVTCSNMLRLYCFGIDRSNPIVPPAHTGKLAFLSEPVTLTGGVVQADGACQMEATSAGRSGTFRALLATDATPANQGVTVDPTRPWVRVDGVVVSTDLIELVAPISVTLSGAYISDNVLFGANALDTPAPTLNTCGNWTDPGVFISTGISSRSVGDAFSGAGLRLCGGRRLYCIED